MNLIVILSILGVAVALPQWYPSNPRGYPGGYPYYHPYRTQSVPYYRVTSSLNADTPKTAALISPAEYPSTVSQSSPLVKFDQRSSVGEDADGLAVYDPEHGFIYLDLKKKKLIIFGK